MICAVIYCSFCCIYVRLDPGTYMIARFMSFYKPGVTHRDSIGSLKLMQESSRGADHGSDLRFHVFVYAG